MNAGWIIPFIILGGALQSCGAAMNGQLHKYVVNPWLASAISFALITFFFAGASLIHPSPLPTQREIDCDALVGCRWRLGWRCAGLCRSHLGQQGRGGPFCGTHGHGRAHHIFAH
jgi:hypothetical protein